MRNEISHLERTSLYVKEFAAMNGCQPTLYTQKNMNVIKIMNEIELYVSLKFSFV